MCYFRKMHKAIIHALLYIFICTLHIFISFACNKQMRSNCDFNISFCSSVQQHALNVNFTSHTFTDVNLQYATHSNGISASVSSPATGLLGLQFSRAVPSQMSAKVYGRYPVSIVSKIILIQWTLRKKGTRSNG